MKFCKYFSGKFFLYFCIKYYFSHISFPFFFLLIQITFYARKKTEQSLFFNSAAPEILNANFESKTTFDTLPIEWDVTAHGIPRPGKF